MNTVPIAFAFDNNLVMPACVCISSLMMNAKSDTFYDIFILHSEKKPLERKNLDRLPEIYPRCRLTYVPVGDVFDNAFEIRGITTAAYYRLLIPELIPQYDKILYSDVDVIFRSDLSDVYSTDLSDNYLGVTLDLWMNYRPGGPQYISSLPNVGDGKYFISSFLLINSAKMLEDNLLPVFINYAGKKYTYQDQDILNIVCHDRVVYFPPKCNMSDYSYYLFQYERGKMSERFTPSEIDEASVSANIHYNGHKPWKTWCVNFDIWWEYYRKSPFFDPEFYFDFFYKRIDEYDRLPLWKRIKILVRYFVFGRKK